MPFKIKKEGKLIFINDVGFQTRNESTFWCIYKADELYKWPDFSMITISTSDYEDEPADFYYSTQNENYDKVVPDFNFHKWSEAGINDYEECIQQIQENGKKEGEINKVGWIGNCGTHINRQRMLFIVQSCKTLFDIQDMRWLPNGKGQNIATNYLSLPDLVKKYKFLIDIEGNGYSGRLKYLLWSKRPLLLVDRPHKEWFFKHLKEWKHYIPVKRDMSDLIEKTLWCYQNYEDALKIAESAYVFSTQYLTRNEAFKEWDRIIQKHIKN